MSISSYIFDRYNFKVFNADKSGYIVFFKGHNKYIRTSTVFVLMSVWVNTVYKHTEDYKSAPYISRRYRFYANIKGDYS